MNLIIKCDDDIVNKYSKHGDTYSNPFGEIIPIVGDELLLGAHIEEFDKRLGNAPMKRYKVIRREFSAKESWNKFYSNQECILYVEEIKDSCDSSDNKLVLELRNKTGVGLNDCKKALEYSKGDINIAIAYLKAISYAVATPGLTFDERVKRFME